MNRQIERMIHRQVNRLINHPQNRVRPDMSKRRIRRPFLMIPASLIPALLLWTSPLLAQGAGSGPPRTLTLEAAIDLAAARNPTLKAAREQINSAEGAVLGAWGAMLPTASFSGLWNFAEKVQEIPNPFASLGGPSVLKIDFTQDYQGSVNIGMPITMRSHAHGYGS